MSIRITAKSNFLAKKNNIMSSTGRLRHLWTIENFAEKASAACVDAVLYSGDTTVRTADGSSSTWRLELVPKQAEPNKLFMGVYLTLTNSNVFPVFADVSITIGRYVIDSIQHEFCECLDFWSTVKLVNRGAILNPGAGHLQGVALKVFAKGNIQMPPIGRKSSVQNAMTIPTKALRPAALIGPPYRLDGVAVKREREAADCMIACVDESGQLLDSIPAHRSALEACSTALRKLFIAARSSATVSTIITVQVVPSVMRCVLHLIDGGAIDEEEMSSANANGLLRFSQRYYISKVQSLSERYLHKVTRPVSKAARRVDSEVVSAPGSAIQHINGGSSATASSLRIVWKIPNFNKEAAPFGSKFESEMRSASVGGNLTKWLVEMHANDERSNYFGVYLRLIESAIVPLAVDFKITLGLKSLKFKHQFRRCESSGEAKFMDRGSLFNRLEGHRHNDTLTIVVTARIQMASDYRDNSPNDESINKSVASPVSTDSVADPEFPTPPIDVDGDHSVLNTNGDSISALLKHLNPSSANDRKSQQPINAVGSASSIVRFLQSSASDALTDCTISVRSALSSEELESFRVHRVVLCCRSSVFRDMFERDADMRTIVIDDLAPATVHLLINALYERPLTDAMLADNAEGLFVAAAKYRVDDLLAVCQPVLRNRIDADSFTRLLTLADNHDAAQLKRACMDYWRDNYLAVNASASFQPSTLGNHLLKELFAMHL